MISIVFFGTAEFSSQILEFLIEKVEIRAVVTQPDRPKGRSLQMAPTPVKAVAEKNGIPVFQPEKCSNPEFLEKMAAVKADLYVVVSFGQILPVKLLQIPPLGCVNAHVSLLPKYRGAAPIHRCLMAGEKETGVSIQKMVKELDAGDVILESKISVPAEMTFGELEQALCDLSKTGLLEVIRMYAKGIPEAKAQDHAASTYAAKVRPEEGEIHWDRPAEELHNLVRAFSPRPGAWCTVIWNGEKKRVKILKAVLVTSQGSPGQLLSTKELIVACGKGALQVLEVQPEGKPKMKAADWLRGAKSLSMSNIK